MFVGCIIAVQLVITSREKTKGDPSHHCVLDVSPGPVIFRSGAQKLTKPAVMDAGNI